MSSSVSIQKSTLRELKYLRDNGVDLGDEERAFVRAAMAQVRAGGLADDHYSAILEAVGRVTVMSDYVGDGWELIDERFYPADM